METTILNEEKSREYLNRGIDQVQKWGEQMVGNVWNWYHLQNAIREYLDAIKYYPYLQHAWTNLAYVCHLIGKVDMAERCLLRSYELAKPGPNHPGENYKNVDCAIKNNRYLSGGNVMRPALELWFEEKYEYYLRRMEAYLEKPPRKLKKILILSANPMGTGGIRFDKEVREIEEGLDLSKYRDQFVIQTKLAVRRRDIRQALQAFVPNIVHFIGHGEEDYIIVEDELGLPSPLPAEEFVELLKLCPDVECVILNACHTAPLAERINTHIDYVIGMKKEIKNVDAIKFSIGFYEELGEGRTIEDAFEFGCNSIRQGSPNTPKPVIPILKTRTKGLAKHLFSYLSRSRFMVMI